MRIALIHGNDGSDVRVGKTCRSLAKLGFDTHFIGWDRRPDAAKVVDLDGSHAHMMQRATPHGRWTLAGLTAYVWHVLSVLRRLRPHVVCVVNEELAILLLPFRGILYRRLVCELYDPLDARHSGASSVERLVSRAVSAVTLRFSDRLIVTDENRLRMVERYAGKAVVIANVPEDPGPELAGRMPEGGVKIWAAGSLDEAHGLRQLLQAVEPLQDVSVVSAGWPYDDFASDVFLTSPRVEYKGIVTAAQALELAAGCDVVFCYYAPINEVMINASPNKVNDALAVGRPVLINSEVKLASWVTATDAGYACEYDDVEGLRRVIAGLAARRSGLPELARRNRALFGQRSWNRQEPELARLYADLAVGTG